MRDEAALTIKHQGGFHDLDGRTASGFTIIRGLSMLEYGDAFLEKNREALKVLQAKSPAAFAVAAEMTPFQTEAAGDEDRWRSPKQVEAWDRVLGA